MTEQANLQWSLVGEGEEGKGKVAILFQAPCNILFFTPEQAIEAARVMMGYAEEAAKMNRERGFE